MKELLGNQASVKRFGRIGKYSGMTGLLVSFAAGIAFFIVEDAIVNALLYTVGSLALSLATGVTVAGEFGRQVLDNDQSPTSFPTLIVFMTAAVAALSPLFVGFRMIGLVALNNETINLVFRSIYFLQLLALAWLAYESLNNRRPTYNGLGKIFKGEFAPFFNLILVAIGLLAIVLSLRGSLGLLAPLGVITLAHNLESYGS